MSSRLLPLLLLLMVKDGCWSFQSALLAKQTCFSPTSRPFFGRAGPPRLDAKAEGFSKNDDEGDMFEMDVNIQDLFRYTANVKRICGALEQQGVENPGGRLILHVDDSPEWLFLQAAYDQGVRTFAVKSGALLRELHRSLPEDADFHLICRFNAKVAQRLKKMPQVRAVLVETPEHTEQLCRIVAGERERQSGKKLTRVSRSRADFLLSKEGGNQPNKPRFGVIVDAGKLEGAGIRQALSRHAAVLSDQQAGAVLAVAMDENIEDKVEETIQLLAQLDDEDMDVTVPLTFPTTPVESLFGAFKNASVPLQRVSFVVQLGDLAKRLDVRPKES
uniref:Orn/DAP/Arg decarboxylase 2 N-terminal domain-containing protein n=1 Tax=Pinguiococcus pyrenoidosus TaxID=172671 RepID=A0A7R9UG57_9STRA|mmetsp:Transcript_8889/g.33557  ORF Transcript_8889/g.33557 Transcript_8889/m.33557 type:complete len:332 (+) Transcript_8889:549-1544(+)